MKVYLATDHAGLVYKEAIKEFLLFKNFDVIDFGANIYNEMDDYPDFIHEAGKALSGDCDRLKMDSFAIVFGGSGTGEAIVMNRYKGVRCVVMNQSNNDIISLSRRHNNANCISFGARFMSIQEIKNAIEIFINTSFDGGRHEIRINKIDDNSLI